MSDKENRRKCFKCGSSPMEDGIKLFRVLKPGKRNLSRCMLWAKFICSEKEVTSIEFLQKLYNEHKMICEKHFKAEDFTDGSQKKLVRTAVPCDMEPDSAVVTMDKAESSGPAPFRNICSVKKSDAHCDMELDPPVVTMDQADPSETEPIRNISNIQKPDLPREMELDPPVETMDQADPFKTVPFRNISNVQKPGLPREAEQLLPVISMDLPRQPKANSSDFYLRDHTYFSSNETSSSPLVVKDNLNSTTPNYCLGSADSLADHTYCSLNEIEMPKERIKELNEPGTSSAVVYDASHNTQQKSEKEKRLQLKCKKYTQKIYRLQKRIKTLKSKNVLNSLLEDHTVQKLSAKITPAFALLLQGQLRNTKRKIRGRRWTKEEKITALRIYKRSPTCYRLLGRLFTLPAPSTLKNLLNKVPFGVGCSNAVFNILNKFIKTQAASDNEYILMFDEMSLKKHVIYNQKTDLIEGYEDHAAQGRSARIAGYALVFMIGGIRKRVKQPVAHYFSSGFSTADRLAVLIKEVLHHCSQAKVNIAAMVCDMDGVNRRALSILGASVERPYVTVGNKEIITLYDTPHLLKCFRNLFMKYDVECNSNIHSADKDGRGIAKWAHIKQFYEIDNANPRFVFAPSLKKDHLNPNSKQKMKVNLAAQVLSHSVAAGIFAKISEGTLTTEAAVTANVLSNLDKLFDAVNSDTNELRRGKPCATNLKPNSPHLNLFKEMKSFFKTLKFIGCTRKPPSQEGWIWTINGIERLWQNLVKKHKLKAMATRRLQQDALENLFGCIRGNCGSNTNPTCGQFVAGLKTAILSKLSQLGTTGNCESDNSVVINNLDTLLSDSKPTLISTEPENNTLMSDSAMSTILFDIDKHLEENTGEIQACAYVCGFIFKLIKNKNCSVCTEIFLSNDIKEYHLFVEAKEYDDLKKTLNYVRKNLIICVEMCATMIQDFLKENSHTRSLKNKIIANLKENVDFMFLDTCLDHKEDNIKTIIDAVFHICIKRFCILKNRTLSEEASASALKRKMDIILHK